MTTDQLIASIQTLNPTARTDWLRLFSDQALRLYLEHLQVASEPRGRQSTWIRRGETRAVVSRTPVPY